MNDPLPQILKELRRPERGRISPRACGGHDTEPPFVTLSRPAGAGGEPLAQRLCDRLNTLDPGERPWACFDRKLVGRVASDPVLAQELIASIGDGGRGWLDEVLAEMATRPMMRPSELRVYRLVAETVLALAGTGRVVLVGLGSAFITHHRTGGLHLRLVAPLSHRIETTAWARQLTRGEALDYIRRTERRREAFFRRFWPEHSLSAESFCSTFNTASTTPDQQVDAVVGMLPGFAPLRASESAAAYAASSPRQAVQ